MEKKIKWGLVNIEDSKFVEFPALIKTEGKTIIYSYPINHGETFISEIPKEKNRYLVVKKIQKIEDVQYILAEDDEYIYIQYGWKQVETNATPLRGDVENQT